MKKEQSILGILFFTLLFGLCFQQNPLNVEAKTRVIHKDITPKEPASSDLKVVKKVTKLAAYRWIQSYTMDSKYYYYIQMTSPYTGNLRITRVKYRGLGRYIKDHMDLKKFGHATNLDCSVSNGQTWLWTGSDCKGNDGKQYYQIYNLAKGRFINPRNPVKRICLSATSGDFQGFDLYGTSIYTIEGSPRKSFLLGYDRSRRYQPTKIRRYNYAARSKKTITVRGAKTLSFREPEGIKVLAGGQIYMMYVSNTLTNQSCNIYRVKRKI